MVVRQLRVLVELCSGGGLCERNRREDKSMNLIQMFLTRLTARNQRGISIVTSISQANQIAGAKKTPKGSLAVARTGLRKTNWRSK
jgi:hypothetical protein